MKFILSVSLLFFCLSVKAQTINDQLYNAVEAKDTSQVEKLLNQGADANYSRKLETFKLNLLIMAVRNNDFKDVKSLIDHKADVNFKDGFGSTPLMYAAFNGDLNIIKYLLSNNADIHFKDGQGNTVLSAAKEGNHPEAIKLIEENFK